MMYRRVKLWMKSTTFATSLKFFLKLMIGKSVRHWLSTSLLSRPHMMHSLTSCVKCIQWAPFECLTISNATLQWSRRLLPLSTSITLLRLWPATISKETSSNLFTKCTRGSMIVPSRTSTLTLSRTRWWCRQSFLRWQSMNPWPLSDKLTIRSSLILKRSKRRLKSVPLWAFQKRKKKNLSLTFLSLLSKLAAARRRSRLTQRSLSVPVRLPS